MVTLRAGLVGPITVVVACSTAGHPIVAGQEESGGIGTSQGTEVSTSSDDSGALERGADGGQPSDDEGDEGPPGPIDLSGPFGWATLPTEALPRGTVGGEGGPTVVVTSIEDLQLQAEDDQPRVLVLEGTVTGVPRIVGSNKTLQGSAGAVLRGGLEIIGRSDQFASNIIVRDLTIIGNNCSGGCEDVDALTVRRTSHLWIDHCDISDGDDGNLDITRETDYVTVSWTRFSYSDPTKETRASNLVGASDDAFEDVGHLNVTFHHNWWDDFADHSMPRIRFGQVHLFNNYYSAAGSSEAIRIGIQADVRLERNRFDGVDAPLADPIDPTALVLSRDNLSTPEPLADLEIGDAFEPPYAYPLLPVADVESSVRSGVGPRS